MQRRTVPLASSSYPETGMEEADYTGEPLQLASAPMSGTHGSGDHIGSTGD